MIFSSTDEICSAVSFEKEAVFYLCKMLHMAGKNNDFILRLLQVFGVVCRLQPV